MWAILAVIKLSRNCTLLELLRSPGGSPTFVMVLLKNWWMVGRLPLLFDFVLWFASDFLPFLSSSCWVCKCRPRPEVPLVSHVAGVPDCCAPSIVCF